MGRAPLRLFLGKKSNAKGGKYVMSATRHVLDQHSFDASVFDDLAYLVLHELREIYEVTSETREVDETHAVIVPFKESAFYQALKTDMRGVKYPTSSHYKRAGERMRDLPESLTDDDYSVEKIIMCLETIGVDADSFKARMMRERQASLKKGAANQSIENFNANETRQKTLVFVTTFNC
jgi:hypothetical protein